MPDKIFADGLIFKEPKDNAPDFVKGSLSIRVDEFTAFLEKHKSQYGWVNIDLKIGKSGNAYAELNTWKPGKKEEPTIDVDDIPFS